MAQVVHNEEEMQGGMFGKLRKGRVYISLYLIVAILIGSFSNALIFNAVPKAEAAQVTIDPDASVNGTSHLQSGSQTVFIDDQTGYKFFRDAGNYCVYRKTTNGGATWSATTTVDSKNVCIQIQVWYDRWTPGDTGNYIHIATIDTTADDIFYNRLDTANSDTLLMGTVPVNASTNSGNSVATLTEGQNSMSITKGTDGTIYATVADASDSYVVECTTNCNLTTGWTETGTNPLDLAGDYSILMPLASGNIMLINRDISLEDIRYKIWNNAAWSGAWTAIDANATDNTTYDVGMAATVSSTTPGVVYLAYADHATLGATNDVRVAKYNGSTWATSTDVISNSATRAITNVAIGLDAATEDVYVAYTARTTAGTPATGNVYWKTATSSMRNWSAERGPVNTVSAGDLYGVDLNLASDERLLVSWFDADVADRDIYGDTIANLYPGIHATTTGTQITTTNAGTSNVYVGGAFVLYNTYKSYDVTGVSITEGGTIDGSSNIANVELYYEEDTSYPYNCASESYGGSESQFGSTDSNGFSGANGVSSFSGTTLSIGTTSAYCIYTVMDVLDTTASNATIELSIADPSSDVTVTGSAAWPATAVAIPGTTTVFNDIPTLTHYHWRNDNGTQATATSKTSGVEDTGYTAFQPGTNARLRIEVSNEGSSSTPLMQYRLEYAETTGSCDAASGWTDVGAAGGVFDMYNSIHMTDGGDTTNVAIATGGVTDENTTFLTPNGGLKDTSSQTAGIVLTTTQYVELEYAITASTTAPEGTTYCFRVTDAGTPLYAYNQYPRTNIAADILVTATGTQTASTNLPATNFYTGGAYVITDNSGSHNVTSITITASGTIHAQEDLKNIKLQYDLDTTAPYDCSDQSYGGGEAQFGATSTGGFSDANGTSTFTGSVAISTTATMCVYTVLDTNISAQNGDTLDILLTNPSVNVEVSGGASVSPTIDRSITGITTFVGAVLTQTHYHWRNDNGTEAAATSMTGGTADTAVSNVAQATPVRLRMQVSNEGSVTSPSFSYKLEYGTKITTCSAVSSWTDVGATGGAFDMYNSSNLTDGTDTTDIAVATGGMNNENTTFLTPNSAVKDTSSAVASTTLSSTQFIEAEFSIAQTIDAGYDTPYCFRLSGSGVPLNAYTVYPELRTSPERDFEIQRGTVEFSTLTRTITAGVDYVAPAASTSAFVRITNTHHTGAGDSSAGGTQNADDVTAYILNPSNIMTSFTIQRPATALATTTHVSWEIVEFIGTPGSDNEMIVRSQTIVTYGTGSLTATGTAATGIADDTDVVVFITGVGHPDTAATNFNSMQSTSAWLAASNQPVFTRGVTGTDATVVSYAVVEFTGPNWIVQRSQHTYAAAGTTETEAITAVNSLSRTMIHTQKRVGNTLTGTDEYGHEVWLSSIGYVSYFLEAGATTPSGQTSVAWIIENTQTNSGAMEVTYSSGNTLNGAEPLTLSVPIGKTLTDITNASIFVNSRAAGTGTLYPRPIAGAIIASTTHYELWRSDTGATLTYRTIVVEWPTAGLALWQNYYRLYHDNNALDPTDPWPVGGTDLGENMALTGSDEPLGENEHLRIRMSLSVHNATFPMETKSFKLQYGAMVSTCSAIPESDWNTLGDTGSSTVWRAYNASAVSDATPLSGNPATGGDLNLSVSDVAGTYEETNDSVINPYSVPESDDVEYDWNIEQNGANAETYYCFRMVESNSTVLTGYNNYPQIRTASFTPRTQNWRWYNDETNETPVTALGNENVSPVDITNGQIVKLRVTVKEIENISRDDVRFKLQYSESANFTTAFDLTASSTCSATSTWCYADGAGADNVKITTKTLSDADSCAGSVGNGCGTHNLSPLPLTGFRHNNSAAAEYEFTLKSAGPRVNRLYYFRLFDITQDIPVPANTTEVYPSLVTEGAHLDFAMTGIASSTAIEGVTLDINTTPITLPFGKLVPDGIKEGAHRLTIDANGTEGYQIFMVMDSDLTNAMGATMKPLTTTNTAPAAWSTGCDAGAASCFGYHTGDDTLEGGSTRFSALDTYARVSTSTLDEVSYSSQPVVGDTTDVVYRIMIRGLQDAGLYEAHIRYVSVPIF